MQVTNDTSHIYDPEVFTCLQGRGHTASIERSNLIFFVDLDRFVM